MLRPLIQAMALATAVVAPALFVSESVRAQEWEPDGPITMLIGFKAGGGADTLARLVADSIQASRGWTIVPENRGGAGGAVMAGLLKNAKPDGQTIGMGVTSTFSANPVIMQATTYGPEDFTYLGTIARSPMVIVARADAPYDSLDEMAAYAKQEGSLSIATMGPILRKVADLIGSHYDINLRVLPTKGGGEALTELLGSHVDLAFNGGAHQKYVDAGELKIVVNLDDQPLKVAPDVGNLQDAGIDYATYIFFQFQAPKGLPEDVETALADAIAEALQDDKVRTMVEKNLRMQIDHLGPDRLTALVTEDAEATKQLVSGE